MQTFWIVIVILLAIALGVVVIYNRLVRRRNLVRSDPIVIEDGLDHDAFDIF
jgi:hypothetical protein